MRENERDIERGERDGERERLYLVTKCSKTGVSSSSW